MKYLMLPLLLLSFITIAFAETPQKSESNKPHKHQSAVGIHGMAVFESNGIFYASHMPLANSMHAHQVIFSFKTDAKNLDKLKKLSNQYPLLSLMPERFDLMHLMSGKLTQFKAKLFSNHFERGGKVAIENIVVEVTNMVLVKSLESVENGNFYAVSTGGKKGLLIHKIGASPSFDQVFAVEFTKPLKELSNDMLFTKLTNGKPITSSLNKNKANEITFIKQRYLEKQDFK